MEVKQKVKGDVAKQCGAHHMKFQLSSTQSQQKSKSKEAHVEIHKAMEFHFDLILDKYYKVDKLL